MKITVRYFAHLKDKLKRDMDIIPVSEGCLVSDLLTQLFPEPQVRQPMEGYLRVAVNEEYTSMNKRLHDGDEVVFIPPVAGG